MKSSNITILLYTLSILFLIYLCSLQNQWLFQELESLVSLKVLILLESTTKDLLKNFSIATILTTLFILILTISFFFPLEDYYLDKKKRPMALILSLGLFGWTILSFRWVYTNLGLLLFFISFFMTLVSLIFIRRIYGHTRLIRALTNLSLDWSRDSFSKHNQLKDENDLFKRLPYQTKSRPVPNAFNLQTTNPKDQFIIFPMLFRHFMIIGGPGAGKTASILKPFMKNSIVNLGQSSFIYDFKNPELTTLAYHFWKQAKQKFGDSYQMKFRSIDFSNPFKSNRCNPLSPRYISSMTFAKQVVDVLYKNLNKEQKDDFWANGAKGYIAASIWFLIKLSKKHHLNLSNFLNLIYFVNSKYSDRIIELMFNDFELQPEISTIYRSRAAENTIGGLLATTSASLSKLADKSLLFVTLEDNIHLNINDPKDPTILCISNKGDDGKDVIYSPIISVFATVLFSKINVKSRMPCSVIIDELPTIILPGLDKLLNTGRSNKLSIMLAMQAYSQLKTGYGDKEADTVKAGCGSIFYGKVMEPEAAKQAHELLGRGEVEKISHSTGKSSSLTINNEQKDILQLSEAFMLPAGGFAGISAGGVLDEEQNDQRFLARFKYMDYQEDALDPFPDQFTFGKNPDNLDREELFESHMNQVIQEKLATLNDLILREHWEFYLTKILREIEEKTGKNMALFIEHSSAINNQRLATELESLLPMTTSKTIVEESTKLVKKFIYHLWEKDFVEMGILKNNLEDEDYDVN